MQNCVGITTFQPILNIFVVLALYWTKNVGHHDKTSCLETNYSHPIKQQQDEHFLTELSWSPKLSPPSLSLSKSKAPSLETFNVTKPIPLKQDKTRPVQCVKTKTNYSHPIKQQQDEHLLTKLSRSLKLSPPSLSLSV